MDFIRRYYTIQEAAQILGISVHQTRRWVKQFLSISHQGRVRLSQKDLDRLKVVYQGFYGYRLRGKALRAFIEAQPTRIPPLEPYAVLREVRRRLSALEERLSEIEAFTGDESFSP